MLFFFFFSRLLAEPVAKLVGASSDLGSDAWAKLVISERAGERRCAQRKSGVVFSRMCFGELPPTESRVQLLWRGRSRRLTDPAKPQGAVFCAYGHLRLPRPGPGNRQWRGGIREGREAWRRKRCRPDGTAAENKNKTALAGLGDRQGWCRLISLRKRGLSTAHGLGRQHGQVSRFGTGPGVIYFCDFF